MPKSPVRSKNAKTEKSKSPQAEGAVDTPAATAEAVAPAKAAKTKKPIVKKTAKKAVKPAAAKTAVKKTAKKTVKKAAKKTAKKAAKKGSEAAAPQVVDAAPESVEAAAQDHAAKIVEPPATGLKPSGESPAPSDEAPAPSATMFEEESLPDALEAAESGEGAVPSIAEPVPAAAAQTDGEELEAQAADAEGEEGEAPLDAGPLKPAKEYVLHEPEDPTVFAFDQFGLAEPIVQACREMGFVRPTEIQLRTIPAVLSGRDVLGQSKTGSGKTAAFMLPVLEMITDEPVVQALVLVPTRELALQVVEEARKLSKHKPVRITAVLGGRSMNDQLEALRKGTPIVVGTPGRVMDHLGRGTMKLNRLRFAVLDEVDRMLDIGFRDDIRQILRQIKHRHQTVFVSATISDEIAKLSNQFMHEPERVFLAPDDLTVDKVEQFYVSVERYDKYRVLKMLLKQEQPKAAIIFAATKRMADELAERMSRDGLNAVEIHGDLEQRRREKVLAGFRSGEVRYLVATDLASRGLDIPEVTHIINYDIPFDTEGYVHRIGRTARMGATGKAITLVSRVEGKQLTDIEVYINKQIKPVLVEGFVATEREPDTAEKPVAAPRPPSRFQRFLFRAPAPSGALPPGPIKVHEKTLGSKFAPSRPRRRR